jgi:hypothetical protein
MASTMPTAVSNIQKASNAVLKGTWFAQSNVDKTWLAIVVTAVQGSLGIYQFTYAYEYYGDNSETKLRSGKYGSETVAPATNGTYYKKAIAALKEHVSAVGDTAAAADTNYVSTDIPVILSQDLALIRWNPPNHYSTRPLPFYVNAGIAQTAKPDTITGYDKNGNPIYKAPQVTQTYVNGLINLTNRNSGNLGKIYQTLTTAKTLQTKTIKMKKTGKEITISPKGPEDLWGFKFIYNPTTISYSTSLDSSIDWLQASKDVSAFFGGNTTITFDLYLNRIADMSTLQNPATISQHYPTGLTDEQKAGILTRGTEYDIEYLYRVVNGNPTNTTLLSDTTQQTADFGYITGLPFWLHLHKNMIFKASLASISVNHVMFTGSMIPMLSVVSLSFIRYPETGKTGDVKERLNNYIKTGNW